jgi:hypothetical protein
MFDLNVQIFVRFARQSLFLNLIVLQILHTISICRLTFISCWESPVQFAAALHNFRLNLGRTGAFLFWQHIAVEGVRMLDIEAEEGIHRAEGT